MATAKPPVPGDRLRVCDLCGGVDYDPRDVSIGGQPDMFPKPGPDLIRKVIENSPKDDPETADRLLADLVDTSSHDHHLDCGRQAGCPSCLATSAGFESKHGQALRKSLIARTADQVAPGDDSIVKGE
jgi:hypothetical protein